MADRYPLIIDPQENKLKELPVDDNLIVDSSIILNGNELTIEGGTITINSQILTVDYSQVNNQPFIPSDINQLNDSTGVLSPSNLVGVDIIGQDSTLLVDAVNSRIPYSVLIDTPNIPTDVSQLSDTQNLLRTRLPVLTTSERDGITPQIGDIIFNSTEGTVQVYVSISTWEGSPAEPVPGWTNLFEPPPEPV